MKPFYYTLATLLLAAGTAWAQAQTQAAPAAPPPASGAKAMPDCTKAMKPHDHGMERGVGRTVPHPCDRAAAASAPARAKPVHDHARVHK